MTTTTISGFLVIVLCVFLGTSAHAQTNQGNKLFDSDAVYKASRGATGIVIRQKALIFEQWQCYQHRSNSRFAPDLFMYYTSNLQRLHISAITECVSNLNALGFDTVSIPDSEDIPFTSLKEARTRNMSCKIMEAKSIGVVYSIGFSNLLLIQKSSELRRCFSEAFKSKDKINVVWEKVEQ